MQIPNVLFILLIAVALPNAISNQTPSNHLVSVLQGSNQQLQAIAALGASQQAFSTMTTIVNNVLAAMQKMSLPYYQNQLSLLQSQQTSLMNRLTVLQAQIASNTTMLLKTTNAVSNSLSSQMANMGSIVMLYKNTMNPKISQLMSQINNLSSTIPQTWNQLAVAMQNQATIQPQLDQAFTDSSLQMNKLVNIFSGNYVNTYYFQLNPNAAISPIPYCVIQDNNSSSILNINSAIFSISSMSTGVTGNTIAYDLYKVPNPTNTVIYVCDRSRSTFTYIPTTFFISIHNNMAP